MILKKAILFLFFLSFGFIISCSADIPEGINTNAFIISINGSEVGYLSSEDDVGYFKNILKENKLKELQEQNPNIIKVSINSNIEASPAVCEESEIKTPQQLADELYIAGEKISFSVTVNESETKYISFETVYKNSSSYYEGTKVVQTKGENGERELIYEVTYIDGQETERTVVSDTVKKDAVNEVVLVGTKKSTASTGKYEWPLKSVYITSSYGGRTLNGSYDFHLGVDLRASTGTQVYAADGGKVTYAGYLGSYGYLVKILHDNGDYTYYAHLSKINVTSGTRVYKGQAIAKSGATGNVTGAHLHFELRKNGATVNPVSYLPSYKVVMAQYAGLARFHDDEDAYLPHFEQPIFSYSTEEQSKSRQLRHLSRVQ